MRKYIDADKLEKDGWSMVRIRQASPTEMVYETKKPTDFPAADVAEVQHGKWKYKPALPNVMFGFYVCSECGATSWAGSSPYCPNCGKKMMKEDTEYVEIAMNEDREVARGKWVMNERGVYECSVCGRVPTQEEKQYDRYCSYCGAKMDGE